MKIRVGTRGSMLAIAQSEWFAGRLRAAGHDVEMVRVVTEGDVRPIDTTPGEGIFVAAIASAMLRGEIDVAVHSVGPRTTEVARDAGFTVIAEAARQSAHELAAAVVRAIPIEV